MDMNAVIARINELAKKNKEVGLTEEELEERAKLRRIYIDSVTGNLKGHLELLWSVKKRTYMQFNSIQKLCIL